MIKILIVDDERLEREALKFILNKGIGSTIHIEEAANGREAIATFQSMMPDITFLDIKMPGTSGIEAGKFMRNSSPETHIVFLTAFHEFDYAHEAIRIGVDDYLIKPSNEKQILDVTEKIIVQITNERNMKNQAHSNDLKLSALLGHLEPEFLYHLFVRGMNRDRFDNYLSLLSLDFCWGQAGIIKIIYDSYPIQVDSEYQRKILQKRCASFLINSAKSKGLTCVVNYDFSDPLFLLIGKLTLEESPEFNLKHIIHHIQTDLSIQTEMLLGPRFTDPNQAARSYAKARSQENPQININDPHNVFVEFEENMKHSLLQGNREIHIGVVNAMNQWILETSHPFALIKKHVLELSVVLNHFYISRLANGNSIIPDEHILNAKDCNTLASAITLFLSTLFEQAISTSNSKSTPGIDLLLTFLRENFTKDISLEQAASMCRLSVFHFTKVFKQAVGLTFVDYVTQLRIDRACYLLEHSNRSVAEISTDIGYHDPNYFSRVFRKTIGQSPSHFRNKIILPSQDSPD